MIDRRFGKAIRPAVFAALAGAVLAFSAHAAGKEKPEWRRDLEIQLKKDHDCDIKYLSRVVIQNLKDRQAVSARVHCRDRRAFDVTREDAGKPYAVRECATPTC